MPRVPFTPGPYAARRLLDSDGRPYGFGDAVTVAGKVLLVVDLTPNGFPICAARLGAHTWEVMLHPTGVRLARRASWPTIAPP